jgi:ATP-dependent Lon protease
MAEVQETDDSGIPVLPLRDVVVYPHMVIPLFVGRERSIVALDRAMNVGKRILLVAQKTADLDDPQPEDLYDVGTLATILQLLKLPDGTVKVLVEGGERASIDNIAVGDHFAADITILDEEDRHDEREIDVLVRSIIAQFEQYVKLNKKVPPEILTSLSGIDEPGRLADTVAAHMSLKLSEKQRILEIQDIKTRLEQILGIIEGEIDVLQIEKRIRGRVKQQMEKSQREYYLNEQMKAIQKELGEMEDAPNEIADLEQKIEKAGMSKEAKEKATSAEDVLEADHYGLEKVKERILEYLAVQQRVKKLKGPILCLVGPPGVGKTSLGQSIARSTNREFVRMSLGGVRDEAEIRGHRRTYIGSMPGKIIHEVLDPEQNSTFQDHYLEVDFDLSDVMFVCTANSLNIPAPLLDRMEVIRIPGYTEDEKLNIATRYLIPKQMKENGLKEDELLIAESTVREIIQHYTRESGVRNLEREISKICRKVVKQLLLKPRKSRVTIQPKSIEKYLGVRRYRYGKAEEKNQVGQVTGLAWTEAGGELLTIEAAVVPGKGKLTHTGQLGEVMTESIQAAMTVVRSRANVLGIDPDFHQKLDVHIHVPEGATPKDGPSAGVGMCTSLVSALCDIPVRGDVAMTGEITLRGEVLPIGGLKEKLLAAHRGGISKVLIPQENEKDLAEIPKNIKDKLTIVPVKWIDGVLEQALTHMPVPETQSEGAESKPKSASKEQKTEDVVRPH